MKKSVQLCFLLITLSATSQVNFAQAPNLGTTANFSVFTAVGAVNNQGASVIIGDAGTHVGAFNGFPPGIITGQTHVADGVSAQAAADVEVAYNDLSAATCGATNIGTTFGNGLELNAGVYCVGAASTFNGTLTLNGQNNPGALFIFKINGALATGTLSNIMLINGASWNNVYWQVNGQVDIQTNSLFRGTILANGAINLLEGAFLEGRALSRAGAISLNNNRISNSVATPLPVVLLSFTAIAQTNHAVDIHWATSLEVNNKGFVIERSKNMKEFEKVGEGYEGTTNSNSLRNYTLVDYTPYIGTSYYRLTQTDLNGQSTTYPAVSVVIREEGYGVFPNPIFSGRQFTLRLDEPETALINFYSMDGRLVPIQKTEILSGNLLLKTQGKLPIGTYILTVSERGQLRKHRIVVE